MTRSIINFIRQPLVLVALALLTLIAILILMLGGYFYRSQIRSVLGLNGQSTRPDHEFGEREIPPAPDYADTANWMALPGSQDLSDLRPNGEFAEASDLEVDLFWVHPTTYGEKTGWNQPVAEDIDTGHLASQASIFNICCRIFAPRYRQATIHSFFEFGESGPQAIDLAYQDVRAAFLYYLENENKGRPFILAGHSQGSTHLDRLIREEILGQPLEAQMIIAYLVGHDLEIDGEIPVCRSAQQTGCAISWNAIAGDADLGDHPTDHACVNPLTWEANGPAADFSQHIGALYLTADLSGELETNIVDGTCADGHLRISEIRSEQYPQLADEPYYHEFDYALFYADTQANVETRLQAYFESVN